MEEHRKKGASRRSKDRRDENLDVDVERRIQIDQRQGYQRKSNRRSGRDRRND